MVIAATFWRTYTYIHTPTRVTETSNDDVTFTVLFAHRVPRRRHTTVAVGPRRSFRHTVAAHLYACPVVSICHNALRRPGHGRTGGNVNRALRVPYRPAATMVPASWHASSVFSGSADDVFSYPRDVVYTLPTSNFLPTPSTLVHRYVSQQYCSRPTPMCTHVHRYSCHNKRKLYLHRKHCIWYLKYNNYIITSCIFKCRTVNYVFFNF